MFVCDEANKGAIHFVSGDMGESDLDHINETRIIVKALHQRMQEMPQIRLYRPAKLEAIEFNQDKTRLTLQDKTELTANIVVRADGTR